jgi:hypothetical protein
MMCLYDTRGSWRGAAQRKLRDGKGTGMTALEREMWELTKRDELAQVRLRGGDTGTWGPFAAH